MRIITSLALLAAISTPALSDGFPNGYKEPASAHYYSGRPTSYRSESRQGIRRWLDDRDMALAKCLKRNAERRQSGLSGRDCAAQNLGKSYVKRISRDRSYAYDPRPTRYAASRYPRYDADERRDNRACQNTMKVAGHERLGRDRAERSAENAWRTAVSAEHGYRYLNLETARGVSMSCSKIRGQTFAVYVCTLAARPCR